MAYVPKSAQEKEQEYLSQFQAPLGEGSTMAPTAPIKTSAPPGPVSGGSVSSPTREYQPFANLSDYLRINAPRIQEQAQGIVEELGSRYGEAQTGAEQAGQQFATDVEAGYTQPDMELVMSALANPTEFVQTPENVEAFQAQLKNAYTGPTEFAYTPEYAEAQEGVAGAQEFADLFGTEGGVGTYLQGKAEDRTYTPGMRSLDVALLRQSPEAIQSVTSAAEPFANLSEYLSQISEQAGTNVQEAKVAATESAQEAQERLSTALSGFADKITSQAEATRTMTTDQANSIRNKLTNQENLTDEELALLGVTGDQISQIYNTASALATWFNNPQDITAYLMTTGSPTTIVPANVATPEQYAEYAALMQLAEQSPSVLFPENVSQAGTAVTDILDLSSANALQALTPLLTESVTSPIIVGGPTYQQIANAPVNDVAVYLGQMVYQNSQNPEYAAGVVDNPMFQLFYNAATNYKNAHPYAADNPSMKELVSAEFESNPELYNALYGTVPPGFPSGEETPEEPPPVEPPTVDYVLSSLYNTESFVAKSSEELLSASVNDIEQGLTDLFNQNPSLFRELTNSSFFIELVNYLGEAVNQGLGTQSVSSVLPADFVSTNFGITPEEPVPEEPPVEIPPEEPPPEEPPTNTVDFVLSSLYGSGFFGPTSAEELLASSVNDVEQGFTDIFNQDPELMRKLASNPFFVELTNYLAEATNQGLGTQSVSSVLPTDFVSANFGITPEEPVPEEPVPEEPVPEEPVPEEPVPEEPVPEEPVPEEPPTFIADTVMVPLYSSGTFGISSSQDLLNASVNDIENALSNVFLNDPEALRAVAADPFFIQLTNYMADAYNNGLGGSTLLSILPPEFVTANFNT